MTQITSKVYAIEGITHPDPRGKVFPYLFVEDQDNLTLIDPSFLSQLPILEKYLLNVGYDIKNVRRIILTHVHVDHLQAANEIVVGADGVAVNSSTDKVYVTGGTGGGGNIAIKAIYARTYRIYLKG